MAGLTVVTDPTIDVEVSSSVSSITCQKRFAKNLTILELKGKLEVITGARANSMALTVFNKDNCVVCNLDNDGALLGSYPVDDDMRIFVSDKLGKFVDFEDTSNVEKFEISQEEYNSRADSVRAFKKRNKLGEFREISAEEKEQKEREKREKEEHEQQLAAAMKIGDRCQVEIQGQPHKRGQVKFVGKVHFKPGLWVGVHYDEPLGKNDGSVGDTRYFECPPKYGGFVPISTVQVGDFPELGLDDELDEM